MNISVRKLKALFHKDFIDYFKNPAMVVCSLIPLFFVVLYKNIALPNLDGEDSTAFLLILGMMINSSMCAVLIPSTSIAEEKEKYTLRTLILSNVSAMEFFAAKILTTVVITFLGNMIVFGIASEQMAFLPAYILCTVFGNSCVIMLGAVIGIMCRDQASCNIWQIVVMLLFLIPPMFTGTSKALEILTKITPYGAMLRLYYGLTEGGISSGKMAAGAVVIMAWLVFSIAAFAYLYKKKGVDN